MKIIDSREIERLVCEFFPERRTAPLAEDLGINPSRPLVTFVHGGPDPFLDRQFEAWLNGSTAFVSAYQLLNRLCRAGALPPGNYAVRSAAAA